MDPELQPSSAAREGSPAARRRRVGRTAAWMAGLTLLAALAVVFRPAWESRALAGMPDAWVAALAEHLPDDGLAQLEAGIRARASVRLADAERHLGAASRSLRDSPAALSHYALALAERGDFISASRAFERANTLAPENADVLTVKARYFYFTKGPVASLEVLDPLLRRYPRQAEAWYTRAMCCVDLQNTRLAAEAAQRAIRIDPRWAAFYREAAQISHQVGDLPGAERMAREALRRAPQDQVAALVLARVLLDRKTTGAGLDEARALLNRVAERRGLRPAALCELGRAAALGGNWQEAARLLEQARDLDPQDAGALYHLAEAYRHLGYPLFKPILARFRQIEWEQRQERFLRGAVKEQVTVLEPRERLVEFYASLGRREDAAAVIEDYLARVPGDARALAIARRLRLPLASRETP
jgi:tetratricopeptide (TPR) repeat protein